MRCLFYIIFLVYFISQTLNTFCYLRYRSPTLTTAPSGATECKSLHVDSLCSIREYILNLFSRYTFKKIKSENTLRWNYVRLSRVRWPIYHIEIKLGKRSIAYLHHLHTTPLIWNSRASNMRALTK